MIKQNKNKNEANVAKGDCLIKSDRPANISAVGSKLDIPQFPYEIIHDIQRISEGVF